MLALEQAMQIAEASATWDVNDDLCDCTFQRIGYWFNPYIGETLEVRMCCIWKEIYKQFPQFVKVTKQEPAEWNGEADMPRSIWHRQLANHLGMSVSEARGLGLEPPSGKPIKAKPILYLKWGGDWAEVRLG